MGQCHAYDPETNLVHVQTPAMLNPLGAEVRGAQHVDNLYTCSILAVDNATGKLKCLLSTVPTINWDFDSVQQLMLLSLTINGRPRKVITQAAHGWRIKCWTGPRGGPSLRRLSSR